MALFSTAIASSFQRGASRKNVQKHGLFILAHSIKTAQQVSLKRNLTFGRCIHTEGFRYWLKHVETSFVRQVAKNLCVCIPS